MNIENSKNEILVCVPTFNSRDGIEKTLQSILAQTERSFDILVVDNHSKDGTVDIVQQFKDTFDKEGKLSVIQNSENLGRIGNWNKCLDVFRSASYKYLKFVFAGDTIEEKCLERLVSIFKQYPHVGLAASGYFIHASDEKVEKKISFLQPQYHSSLDALKFFLQKGNWVGAPVSCMFAKNAVGSRNFREKLGWAADWKFYVDVAASYDSFYIPELLGRFYALQRKYYSKHRKDFGAAIQDFFMYGFIFCLLLFKRLRSFLHFLKIANIRFLYWLLLPGKKRYAYMQKLFYNQLANASDYTPEDVQDRVVGSYHAHNAWQDYDEYVMRYVDSSFKEKLALDFGCGPGRSIVKYHERFKQLDGVDISEKNIEHAREQLRAHGITNSKLYVNNGQDLAGIGSATYDLVMSTICLQHICVYRTRYNLLKEFFRVLKKGGRISIQMGYGKNSPNSVPYEADNVNALTTNRGCDTRVESPEQIGKDLAAIGFTGFEYWVRPTGPGDTHPNWIYFCAMK